MSETRPTSEQLRFTSSKTGEQVLDTYLEAAERGNRSIPDLVADLFDASGVIRQNLEWRINAGYLEFRQNSTINPAAAWTQASTFFVYRGTHVPSTSYNALDYVLSADGRIFLASLTTTATPPAAPWVLLSPSTIAVGTTPLSAGTSGRVIYNNAGVVGEIAPGSSGNLLTSNGTTWTSQPLTTSPSFPGTPTASTAAVDTSTTQIATTAFVTSQAASAAPQADGTAAVGTSLRYARQDHVHPTDTSRAPLANPTFTGTVTIPAGASISGYAVTSHTHAIADTTGLQAALDAKLPLAGGTLTGAITLSGAPTATLHAATKSYVDTGDAARLPLTGGTLTGTLTGTTANFSGQVTIRNGSPTIYLQDTDNKGGAIHCNSDLVYIISCPVDSQTFSTPPNGRWPFTASTSSGDVTIGRDLYVNGGLVTANILTAPDTRGGIFQSQYGGQATIKTPWGTVQFHWDGNAFHFAADGGGWQRLARSSNISYHDIRTWGDPWAILHSDGGTNFIVFVDVISSDIRFKENVAATKVDSLKYITGLSLIEFDWNADGIAARSAPGGRVNLGVIAQEIAQFCPEAVPLGPMTLADGSEEDRHRIRYELMTPHLIRSIQQQQERIDQHEAKIQQQAALIANLADRLATLEGGGA